jgi:DNA repair protein RecN (Recombination protein N)
LSATQARLANAADLIAAANEGASALSEADDALAVRLSQLTQRLRAVAGHDPALADVVALLEPAAIQLDEAARALRDYQRRLDLDPAELKRVEERLSAIHDVARKHRVRPEALPPARRTEARLAALRIANADARGARREAEKQYHAQPANCRRSAGAGNEFTG